MRPPALAVELRLALCGLLGAALTLLPGYEFGQREHLVVIAILPHALASARARRPPGRLANRELWFRVYQRAG